jgi:hypothetical protein
MWEDFIYRFLFWSFEALKGYVEDKSKWKTGVLCKERGGGLESRFVSNMACMKYTTRKGSSLRDSQPESSRKKSRIENAARDFAWMYHSQFHRKARKQLKNGKKSLRPNEREKEKTRWCKRLIGSLTLGQLAFKRPFTIRLSRWRGI